MPKLELSGTMKGAQTTIHPDISDILARKSEGRRHLSRLSFGRKIALVEELRERLAPLKRAREQRAAARSMGRARSS